MIAVGLTAPTANAADFTPGVREQIDVYSAAMGRNISVQVQWAKRGGNSALYLLDGLRADDYSNGWQLNTNAASLFANDNVTLVAPVGGRASFYTDWLRPSSTNGQTYTYKWETFLTKELPDYLATRGVSRTNNAIAGPSMGGNAAFTIAAYHRDQFKFAGSFSGFLNLSSPGMPELVKYAMSTEQNYNADDMWGPPSNPLWRRNDPSALPAANLRGLSLYVSAATGIPGPHDKTPSTPKEAFDLASAQGIELAAQTSARAFQFYAFFNGIKATFNFPSAGTHSWGYWQDQIALARPQILRALGA